MREVVKIKPDEWAYLILKRGFVNTVVLLHPTIPRRYKKVPASRCAAASPDQYPDWLTAMVMRDTLEDMA